MALHNFLILAFWLALMVYWALSSIHAKRSVGGARLWGRELGLRLAILALVLLILRVSTHHHAVRTIRLHAITTSRVAGFVGAALCAIGVAVAIWARACLGRNWGMPMARKVNPELITRGPYAHIRHPIYAGIILAMLGSTIGASLFWAIPLLTLGSYFLYSARREERLMVEQFPQQYPAYMQRTRMLIPFIW